MTDRRTTSNTDSGQMSEGSGHSEVEYQQTDSRIREKDKELRQKHRSENTKKNIGNLKAN